MKGLILAVALVASAAASASNVGGIVGDKIHFQADSTWVSSYGNSSICLNGDTFEAMINKCVAYRNARGGEECAKYAKVKAFQPMNSTREVCTRWTGRDQANCVEYKTVPYFQSRVRTVKIESEHGSVLRTLKVVIPDCE